MIFKVYYFTAYIRFIFCEANISVRLYVRYFFILGGIFIFGGILMRVDESL